MTSTRRTLDESERGSAASAADEAYREGNRLLAEGHASDACSRFEEALDLAPEFAQAHNNLGAALQALGRLPEALERYLSALAFQPDYPEAAYNAGNALQLLGRPAEALDYYHRALELRPSYAEAHYNLAKALQALDRHDQAEVHYRQAIELAPGFADAHVNLGTALTALGRDSEAAESYRAALEIDPHLVEAHINLGLKLQRTNRHDEAIAHFEAALQSPSEPVVHNLLANLYTELGQFEEAEAHCRRAIALAPAVGVFHRNLSNLKRFRKNDPDLRALERLAAQDDLTVEDRIQVDFALGKAYADTGEFERSFEHYRAGNALKRQSVVYDEAQTKLMFGCLQKAFSPELIESLQGYGDESAVPVFIVGMPRSGTTLVEQILASHPDVFGGDELGELGKAIVGMGGFERTMEAFSQGAAEISGPQIRELGARYVERVRLLAPEATRITDKLPSNFLFLGLIHLALPRAHVIHVRRDPIDTCVSCYTKLFAEGSLYVYDLGELGRYYRAYERLMDHWRRVLPADAILEVRYEDLLDDLEGQARRIVAYCGLPWHPACLAFHETRRPVRTASATQVRQPLYRDAVGRWRRYKDHLAPLLQELQAK